MSIDRVVFVCPDLNLIKQRYFALFHEGHGSVEVAINNFVSFAVASIDDTQQRCSEAMANTAGLIPYEEWRAIMQVSEGYAARLAYAQAMMERSSHNATLDAMAEHSRRQSVNQAQSREAS